MTSIFLEENLKKAFCKMLSCMGIGAAEADCESLFHKVIKVIVPGSMHNDLPNRLLSSANSVCTKEPFYWRVDQKLPHIFEDTTFQEIFNNWFIKIVNP